MNNSHLLYSKPNEAWIIHREEIETLQEGSCNVYVLLDAYSGFCFGQEASVDAPDPIKINKLLQTARAQGGAWPHKILIQKSDPFAHILQTICQGINISFNELSAKDLRPYIQSFKDGFHQFRKGAPLIPPPAALSKADQEELDAFTPESYSPCPCASGKKFKFCCQRAFKDIVFAMCAAEEGRLDEALRYMKQAEGKVGRTAEVLCRYAICWSFFDMDKCRELLQETIQLNPEHPRANYILGIEAVADGEYDKAVAFYQTAIDNYPKEDRYHLNETYNNQGTAYYELKKYEKAKEVWEKALVLIPSDQMVRKNLFEFIYENPVVSKDLRVISPFIKKYLNK